MDLVKKNEILIRSVKPLIEEINSLSSSLLNRTLYNESNRLAHLLSEYEEYNKMASMTEENVEPVNFYECIEAYCKSYDLNRNKVRRPVIKFNIKDEVAGVDIKSAKKITGENLNYFELKNCMPILKVVPTALLDNAIKYSVTDGEIVISIEQTNREKKITIENIGPILYSDEYDDAFGVNFRGRNAEECNVLGFGMGLNVVKTVVNSHPWLSPDVYVESDQTPCITIEGIPYSQFRVNISFKEQEGNLNSNLILKCNEDVNKVIKHQFIRIFPELINVVLGMSNSSKASDIPSEISTILSEKTFAVKDIIFETLLEFQCIDKMFIDDLKVYEMRNAKPLIKQIKESLENIIKNDKLDIKLSQNGREYPIFPMYSPVIEEFSHLFAKYVLSYAKAKEVVLTTSSECMEYSCVDGFDYYKDDLDVISRILEEYSDYELICGDECVSISRK